MLHPILGLETGYVSNVFYDAAKENPTGAGILRLIAQIGTGSLSPQRLAVQEVDSDAPTNLGSLQYRADLRATYDVYLSGRETLKSQNGLGLGALFRGTVMPGHTVSFLFLEDFNRLIRATNFESTSQTNRDINRLQLGLQIAPAGRSVSGLLHFENVIDLFEDQDQRFANRMQNSAGATVSWRFRPITVFFGDATIGFNGGLGSASTKVSSYPLTVAVGVQTLLSLKTTLSGHVGYTNGFYASGPSYSAVLGGLQVGWRYTPNGRITALYDYSHQDSINANYFRDHEFGVMLEHQVKPLVISVRPELRFRRYEGVRTVVPSATSDSRDDTIFMVAAGLRYSFRDSFAAVLEYRFSTVQTNFKYMSGAVLDDPSYARHEVVAGVRAAL